MQKQVRLQTTNSVANSVRAAEDEDTSSSCSSDKFEIIERKSESIIVEITLSETVDSNFAYAKLLSKLRDLPYNTEAVHLYLANFGGSCHTGVQLFNAFRYCEVPVDVTVSAPCFSMGAVLALAGRSLKLDPGTYLMFHNYSALEVGKGQELTHAVNHYAEYTRRYDKKILTPFLTLEEVIGLRKDQDVYVSWDDKDLKDRIQRHFHSRRKRRK